MSTHKKRVYPIKFIAPLVIIASAASYLSIMPINSDNFWVTLPAFNVLITDGPKALVASIFNLAINVGRPPLQWVIGYLFPIFEFYFARTFNIDPRVVNWVCASLTIFVTVLVIFKFLLKISPRIQENDKKFIFIFTISVTIFMISNSSYYHEPIGIFLFTTWLINLLPLYAFLQLLIYIKTSQTKSLIWFALINLLAVNGNEANFLAAFGLMAYFYYLLYSKKIVAKSKVLAIVVFSQTLTLISILHWYLVNKSGKAQWGYEGVKTSFNVMKIFLTFFYQIIFNLPIIGTIRQIHSGFESSNKAIQFSNNTIFINNVVFLICLFYLLSTILYMGKNNFLGLTNILINTTKSRLIENQLILGLFAILAANIVTYSLSMKYQEDVLTYKSFYLSLGLFATTVSIYIANFDWHKFGNKAMLILAFLSTLQLYFNFQQSQLTLSNQNYLVSAGKIIANISVPESEMCETFSKVEKGNYGGLGAEDSKILQSLAYKNSNGTKLLCGSKL